MNGILLLNKEKGITSHQAIAKVKRITKAKKVGHAGTLDPLATGLLVVMLNNATKLSNYLMAETKEYIAEIVIGVGTDTLDSEGVVTSKRDVLVELDVDHVLKSFLGKSMQVPPMYSAIKQKGKKLYELAREGKEVKRSPREIEIYSLERISDVIYKDGIATFSFKTNTSKGTYIRSLCEDIGRVLGYPAHMLNLKRTKTGNLDIVNSYTLNEIEEGKFKLIKMHEILDSYANIEVDNDLCKLILNGMELDQNIVNSTEEIVVFTHNNELIAIYKKEGNKYKAERVWN